MFQLSPNIDLLFAEAGESAADRVRAAAAAGFDAVEMWGPTGKDIPALKHALEETGVQLTSQLAEPRMQFMIPPRNHDAFYTGLDAGVEVAQQLGCPRMVVGSGTGFGGRKRQDQLDELIEIFTRRRRAHRGFRHHPGPRTGQRQGRPPGSPAGPDLRSRLCRPGRQLAELRRSLRPLPLHGRGRGRGRRARQRRRPHQVCSDRRRAGARRTRLRIHRLARPAHGPAEHRATPAPSGSSTTRRSTRRSPSGASRNWWRDA